jgi:hypothetical protein
MFMKYFWQYYWKNWRLFVAFSVIVPGLFALYSTDGVLGAYAVLLILNVISVIGCYIQYVRKGRPNHPNQFGY